MLEGTKALGMFYKIIVVRNIYTMAMVIIGKLTNKNEIKKKKCYNLVHIKCEQS